MNHNAFPTHEEDPLAGDVDKFVHPDETRTDEQIAYDEKYAVEPYDGDAADGYWDEYDALYPEEADSQDSHEDKPGNTNKYSLLLTKTVQDKVREAGKEADYPRVQSATFVLKDAEGTPTDKLVAYVDHYDGTYRFDGVNMFNLAPVDGEKDAWDRDIKFVRGHFDKHPGSDTIGSAFSMSYGGGSPDQLRDYAAQALQEDALARAELVDLDVYTQE